MEFLQFFPAILSLGLICGGAFMVIEAARSERKLIAERVAFVSARGAAQRPSRADEGPEAGLVRISAAGLDDADLLEITRICRRIGVPDRRAPFAFAMARLLLGGAMILLTLTALHSIGQASMVGALAVVAITPLAAAAGWLLPFVIIRRMTRERADEVTHGLPEALELLVVCVEAGLSLEDGLDRITEELKRSQPALAEELATTAADLKVLPDRDAAFNAMAERVGSPAVRSVMKTLSQTLRFGTPLANALRTAAAELRNESLLLMEERANRLPSLLTVPMMLFIMPTIFMIVGGPAVLRLMAVLHR
ncbi:type II secretion system F family protein [Phenylobacterium soli]|uniref:Type II secretion system F family protein n=1 Tax=Phenylobacterium soli TaxID=2170551 RepID=A0A328AQZ6_9CAUL|nr:type II secretion system F family protein [Phenylobacterium soli]RAK55934.1 type II secretion system F family protein [Phenylobacterium soli]